MITVIEITQSRISLNFLILLIFVTIHVFLCTRTTCTCIHYIFWLSMHNWIKTVLGTSSFDCVGYGTQISSKRPYYLLKTQSIKKFHPKLLSIHKPDTIRNFVRRRKSWGSKYKSENKFRMFSFKSRASALSPWN